MEKDSIPPDDDDDIYADPPTNADLPRLSSGIGQLPPSDEENDETTVRPSHSISSHC